jgi:hypothetical protein
VDISPDQPLSDLQLRALRIVETQLKNVLGGVTTAEVMKLLLLEFSEVEDQLCLVSALATVGAVGILMLAHDRGVQPEEVTAELRSLMAPQT